MFHINRMAHTSIRPLNRRLVLIIEDEPFLAGYITQGLTAAGAQVLGPARTAGEANELLARLRTNPDAIVTSLDIFEAPNFTARQLLTSSGAALLLTAKRPRMAEQTASPYNVLTRPFAAYQIVEHIQAALEAASPDRLAGSDGPMLRGH